MSVQWVNVYNVEGKEYACEMLPERSPIQAQLYAVMPQNAPTFIRVEKRSNGHWHRPPVGMRADQASHFWTLRFNVHSQRYETKLVQR